MARTFGVTKSPTEITEFIEHQVKVNIENVKQGRPKYTVCIWGPKGVGKTDIVKQLEQREMVKHVISIPLAQIEEMGDIHGLPIKAKEEDSGRIVTQTAPPSWVPLVDEPGIVMFDDFNRADLRIIKAFMQLLQDGKTISWDLPPQYTIVLTANPEDDEYAVTALDPAMLTRMVHITLKPDVRSWLTWASANKIDSRVQSFIARYKEQLNPGSERTCPRTWVMFADLIRDIQDLKNNLDYVKTYGWSVLDEEAVNTFIIFINGELELVVEPELICEEYTTNKAVRDKVLSAVSANRTDVVNIIFERLLAYLAAKGKVAVGSNTQKNVIALLEEDTISKDIKTTYVNLIGEATQTNTGSFWLSSAKLAKHLRRVIAA